MYITTVMLARSDQRSLHCLTVSWFVTLPSPATSIALEPIACFSSSECTGAFKVPAPSWESFHIVAVGRQRLVGDKRLSDLFCNFSIRGVFLLLICGLLLFLFLAELSGAVWEAAGAASWAIDAIGK